MLERSLSEAPPQYAEHIEEKLELREPQKRRVS